MKRRAPRITQPLTFSVIAYLCLVAGGCTTQEDDEKPSGAVCPDDSTVTYAGFVAPFMTRYCNDCHGSTVKGADREGAPSDHNFDLMSDVLKEAVHIDEEAAAGPNSTNEAMPPSGTKPTLDERKKLGEWIACQIAAGAVDDDHGDDDHHADGGEDHDHPDGSDHDGHDAGT